MDPELFSSNAPNGLSHAIHSGYLSTESKAAQKYSLRIYSPCATPPFSPREKEALLAIILTKYAFDYISGTTRPKTELAHQVSKNFGWL